MKCKGHGQEAVNVRPLVPSPLDLMNLNLCCHAPPHSLTIAPLHWPVHSGSTWRRCPCVTESSTVAVGLASWLSYGRDSAVHVRLSNRYRLCIRLVSTSVCAPVCSKSSLVNGKPDMLKVSWGELCPWRFSCALEYAVKMTSWAHWMMKTSCKWKLWMFCLPAYVLNQNPKLFLNTG